MRWPESERVMRDEIEREEWAAYFKEFSRRNALRPTRLELFGAELGAQEQEHGLLLLGVSVELSGPEAPRIEITLGEEREKTRHLAHAVTRARRVLTKRGADGADEALEIEDADGVQTLLRFAAPSAISATS